MGQEVPVGEVLSADSAIDPAGATWVVGSFTGEFVAGGHRVPSAGGTDAFVMKLDRDGETLWARAIGGPGDDRAESVAAAKDGVVVTGSFAREIAIGETRHVATGERDLFVASLDRDGAAVWSRSYSAGAAPVPAPPPVGELRIVLMAGGWADVYLDGRKLESTAPLANYALPAGTYEVRLENAYSGLSLSETVVVSSGKTTTIHARRY